MAQNRPGGEPTEQPTPKRLREAREKGQVARSQELTAALSFGAGCAVLLMAGGLMWERLRASTRGGLAAAVGSDDPTALIGASVREAIDTVLFASLPVVGAAALLAAVTGYLQVGALFTTKPLTPDLARLNPLEGAKRLFSKRTWVELLKSIVKITIVAILAWDLLERHWGAFARMPSLDGTRAFFATAEVAGALLFRVVIFYAIVGAADLLWQRHATNKELMMTREEVKREHKEQEGDPQHKAERQRLHRDLLRHQMIEAVRPRRPRPRGRPHFCGGGRPADAVIVNPDHIAVALRYDEATMSSPKVVATGRRLVAQQIKDVARRYGVPIYRDVPLARSLVELELDDEIPEELYEAVAAVLRFVYAQRDGGQGGEP